MSDLSRRETWEWMKRSRRKGFDWRRLSSLAAKRPSFPISFFRLHIDKLGLVLEAKLEKFSASRNRGAEE
ncbi:hypothetical protein LINGRAHAP2_LOCUS23641, partial [Linum grandiflorum]